MAQQLTATLLLTKSTPLDVGARWLLRLDISGLPSNEDGAPALFRAAQVIADVPDGITVRQLAQEARAYEIERYNRVRVVTLEIENTTSADIALDGVEVSLVGLPATPREAGIVEAAGETLAQSGDWSATAKDGVALVAVAAQYVADAREPLPHAATHTEGGTDPIAISASQVTGLGDSATLNVGTAANTVMPGDTKFDLLSQLAQNEIEITGAAALTPGRMHVCSGVTADYTVTLPTATDNAGKIVGVRMSNALTKLVTVAGASEQLIDEQNTRVMWAQESAILLCDGVGWNKVAGVSQGIFISARDGGADQPIAADTITTLDLTAKINDVFSNVDLAANTIAVPRSSVWQVYRLNSLYDFSASSGGVDAGIIINTSANYRFDRRNVIYAGANTGTQCYPALNVNIMFNAGDVITPKVFVAAATAKTLAGANNVYSIISLTEIPAW